MDAVMCALKHSGKDGGVLMKASGSVMRRVEGDACSDIQLEALLITAERSIRVRASSTTPRSHSSTRACGMCTCR